MAATSNTAPAVVDVDSAARTHMSVALAFLALAALFGVLAALKAAFPGFVPGAGFMSYGRLLPMATNTLVFGFLTFMHFAAAYFIIPRVAGAPLANERIARLAAGPGAALTLVAVLLVGSGLVPNQGRLLGEFHPVIDLLLVAFYLVPLGVTLQTLSRRTVETMYVSVWYIVGGLIWLVGLMVIGANPFIGGVGSALLGAFYTSGMVGLWAVGVGIGAAYYVIPRATDQPLYSRSLALAGFWSLAFAQLWTGPAAMIFGPAADWIETIGVVFTLGMIVPALAVLANFIGTLDGAWDLVRRRSDVRFAVAASVLAVFLAFVSGAIGFRSVAVVTGETSFWFITQYGLLYGVASLYAASFAYYAMPKAFGRELFSEEYGRRQFRLMLTGVGGVTVGGWLAGLAAGNSWLAGVYTGAYAAVGEGFGPTLDATRWLIVLSVLFALVVAAGQLLMVLNLYRTVTSAPAAPQEVLLVASGRPAGGERS